MASEKEVTSSGGAACRGACMARARRVHGACRRVVGAWSARACAAPGEPSDSMTLKPPLALAHDEVPALTSMATSVVSRKNTLPLSTSSAEGRRKAWYRYRVGVRGAG